MDTKPEIFWTPPDGAPILGVTLFRGNVVIATGSGVYVIDAGGPPMDSWTIHKINDAVRGSDVGQS